MASRLVFDTNYIRKLGSREYLEGTVPERFSEQIQIALDRGDVVCIPRTVQMELNAWVNSMAFKEKEKINQARDLLLGKGFTIEPNIEGGVGDIDALSIIKKRFPDIYIPAPSVDDYLEAERRTSSREPPLPKNPEGEEYRDRLIWCQVLSLSSASDLPTVIVSEDKIFENGTNLEEAKAANISIIKNEEELNQWLDQRPDHIQKIIDDMILFSKELQTQGIEINEEEINRIVDYRSVNEPDGSIIRKFGILFSNGASQTPILSCKILYQGGIPVSISVQSGETDVHCGREFSEDELRSMTITRHMTTSKKQFQEAELHKLIGD